MAEVEKHSMVISVAGEVLADSRDLWAAMLAYQRMPEAEREAARAKAAEDRAVQRSIEIPVDLTLEIMLDRLALERDFAEHLVQPYCECSEEDGGWSKCEHWRDLHPDA